jgi:hypothetical protein
MYDDIQTLCPSFSIICPIEADLIGGHTIMDIGSFVILFKS